MTGDMHPFVAIAEETAILEERSDPSMSKPKHLLPQVPRYFKANLHTHSTITDGRLAPAQIKEAYKEKGYQILSITDHNVIVDHSAMNDSDFLMLTGIEVNIHSPQYRSGFEGGTYHFNLIAKHPENLWSPGKAPEAYLGAKDYLGAVHYEEMDLQYTEESVNEMISMANEKGFLVAYNHPTWSCQSYPDYAFLKGLWAMELRNSECILLGNNENNPRVFKDLLNLGNRIYPLGADDMHRIRALGQSWIMVGAQELCYGSVIEALEQGDFYMSCGPEISSLTMEGTRLKITCSEAKQILLESHGRYASITSAEGDHLLQEAEFDLEKFIERSNGAMENYIHLTVIAPDGSYAATRAYYLKELLEK